MQLSKTARAVGLILPAAALLGYGALRLNARACTVAGR